jgi:ABC-type enterobactin transport system permease subunit
VIELMAAALAATLGGVFTAAGIVSNRVRENREVVIRLTIAVENVGQQLEALHTDIRQDRREMYGRLANLEQRTARLEGARQP